MTNVAEADSLMYDCGLEVLHPGGWEKTEEMARACGVGPSTKILDIGGGRGTTACRLARKYGCSIVAIDVSSSMVDAAEQRTKQEGLEHLVEVRQADAHDLPFEDSSFDVVLIECVTTLLDRAKAFPELRRVLKEGGFLGDLEMIYQQQPAEPFVRRLYDGWEGFSTMPLAGWEKLIRDHGLDVVKVDDFSEKMKHVGGTFLREMGIRGIGKMAWRIVRRPQIARRLLSWNQMFKEGEGTLGYAYFVARKPVA